MSVKETEETAEDDSQVRMAEEGPLYTKTDSEAAKVAKDERSGWTEDTNLPAGWFLVTQANKHKTQEDCGYENKVWIYWMCNPSPLSAILGAGQVVHDQAHRYHVGLQSLHQGLQDQHQKEDKLNLFPQFHTLNPQETQCCMGYVVHQGEEDEDQQVAGHEDGGVKLVLHHHQSEYADSASGNNIADQLLISSRSCMVSWVSSEDSEGCSTDIMTSPPAST